MFLQHTPRFGAGKVLAGLPLAIAAAGCAGLQQTPTEAPDGAGGVLRGWEALGTVWAEVEARIGEHRMRVQLLEDQLQAERHKLQTMGGLSKLVKGKAQEESVDEIEAAVAESQVGEAALLRELDQVEQMSPPPHEGLQLSDKRSINFMILSYAQQMYLDFFEDNLASLAKEASDKSVGAVNYGSKADCDEILECLWKRKEEVEQKENSTELLQKRAKLIGQHAVFRNDDDAVPAPGTVATVFDVNLNGVVSKLDGNLLGENYFGVAKVLSR